MTTITRIGIVLLAISLFSADTFESVIIFSAGAYLVLKALYDEQKEKEN